MTSYRLKRFWQTHFNPVARKGDGRGPLDDFQSSPIRGSSPFRGVTYTTVGYGDLVLAKPWRVLTPIKGLTGALMWLIHGCIFRFREPVYHAVHAPAN
ncbi:ion channel [Paraburkholderia hospita]